METPVKCVAYLRVSGAGQSDKDGFPRQSAAIAEYAEKHGYEIVQTYQETFTGTDDDRPTMRRMLDDLIRSNIGVKTVIVEKVDRLARDLIVQESIIAKFQNYRLTLLSSCEPDLCSDDPSRVFIRQVLGAVAQLDRSLIVRKTRAARERIRATGAKCEGAKIFGDPRYPQEKAVLENIVAMAKDGLKCSQIAKNLNRSGITARRGGKWFPIQVGRIVKRAAKTA